MAEYAIKHDVNDAVERLIHLMQQIATRIDQRFDEMKSGIEGRFDDQAIRMERHAARMQAILGKGEENRP